MDDEKFMQHAITQAEIAQESGELPFGSIIVRNGEIVAENHVTEKQDKTVLAHAELKVVDDACKKLSTNNLSDCTIYCTNEPCIMCAAAIFQAKIPRVVIAISRNDLSHILRKRNLSITDLAKDSGYKITIVKDVLKEQAMQLWNNIHV